MKQPALCLSLLTTFLVAHAGAVEVGASYNTTAPTVSDIANWNTGWGAGGISGWDYVGTVNGASGVYLGNNWVLTAGHVGAGTFTLGITPYSAVVGSARVFGTADLTLFQIDTASTPAPNLPSLAIATSPPTALSTLGQGSSVAMIGFGGSGKSWGLNTVTEAYPVYPDIYLTQVTANATTYKTKDFITAYGTTTAGTFSATNNAQLVGGDSGGGDFIYDSALAQWTLAGINEAVDLNTHDSYMVQLSSYAAQINPISAVPEPSAYALLAMGGAALLFQIKRSRSRLSSRVE